MAKKSKKAPVQFDINEIMNDPDKRRDLAGFVEEAVEAMQKMESNQLQLKSIRTASKDSLGIPPKVLNRLIKENLATGFLAGEVKELEDIQSLSDAIKVS